MINLRVGTASFLHWVRAQRAAAGASRAVNRPKLQRELAAHRPDLTNLLTRIAEQGVVAVEGYWPAERCSAARTAFDRVLREQADSVQTYSGGADQRLYGMETADPLFADFHNDPFLKGFGELAGGQDLYNFATLGGHIAASPGNTGSGDGWHRDAHGYQFKAILYLSDTAPENGPFQYLLGSHKSWRVALDSALSDLADAHGTRHSDEAIARICTRLGATAQSFPAPPGTLLLVNTAGIHRGMPLQSGTRYALTNYYYLPVQVDEARIAQFSPLIPGTAERIRRDLPGH